MMVFGHNRITKEEYQIFLPWKSKLELLLIGNIFKESTAINFSSCSSSVDCLSIPSSPSLIANAKTEERTPERLEAKQRADNCRYAAKHLKKKNDTLKAAISEGKRKKEIIASYQKVIGEKERIATFAVLLNGGQCGTAKATYEAKKSDQSSFLNPEDRQNLEESKRETFSVFQSAKEIFYEASIGYEVASANYHEAFKLADKKGNSSEIEQLQRSMNTTGSRKSRAKANMKMAKSNYDNACLEYAIKIQEEMLKFVNIFLAETVSQIANRVMHPTDDLLQWVHQNGKEEDWSKLREYLMNKDVTISPLCVIK